MELHMNWTILAPPPLKYIWKVTTEMLLKFWKIEFREDLIATSHLSPFWKTFKKDSLKFYNEMHQWNAHFNKNSY